MENGVLTPKSSGVYKRKGISPNEKDLEENKRQKVKTICPVLTKSLNNLTELNQKNFKNKLFVTSSEESIPSISSNKMDTSVDQTVVNSVLAALKEDWVREKMMETVSTKLEEIQEATKNLSIEIQTLKEKVDQQEEKINHQEEEILNLKKANVDREQNDRNKTLRFAGVPENKLEKPIDTIGKLCTKNLDVNLTRGDMMNVYRAGKVPEPGYIGRPRDIIVQFTTNNVRNSVYTGRIKLKKVEGPKIFINEQLTKEQVTLYKETRARIDWKKGHSTWTFYGSVFVRLSKEKNAPSFKIQDLKKLEDVLKKSRAKEKDNEENKDGSPVGSGQPAPST